MVNLSDLKIYKNDYERPMQKWKCGRPPGESPCKLGPDQKGRCRTSYECQPIQNSARWVCARPESMGGKCSEGPSNNGTCAKKIEKCKPVRTNRLSRGVISRIIFSASILLIVFIFSAKYMNSIISPGAVARAHSYIENDCAACHHASRNSIGKWIFKVLKDKKIDEEDILCFECHNMGLNLIEPHNLSNEELKKISERNKNSNPDHAHIDNKSIKEVRENMFCAGCHTEHKGKDFNISLPDDKKCLECHIVNYNHSEKIVPEFRTIPANAKNKHIKINHAKHFDEYFKTGKFVEVAPQGCEDCHAILPDKGNIITLGYSMTCINCHQKQVSGRHLDKSNGIAVFMVPGIDLKTLKKNNIYIGSWPKQSRNKISPFVKFLLSADPENVETLKVIGKLNLLKLKHADKSQLKAVEKIAWAIKELLYEIYERGHSALALRIQKVVDREVTSDESAALLELLPMELFQKSVNKWYGEIGKELKIHENIKNSPDSSSIANVSFNQLKEKKQTVAISSINDKNKEWLSSGGWSLKDFTIYYQPAGHGNRFIRGWIDFTAPLINQNESSPAGEIFNLLSNPESPGICFKCHLVEKDQFEKLQVNWANKKIENNTPSLNKFTHTPHYLMGLEGSCNFCHKLNGALKGAGAENASKGLNNFGDFVSVKMSTCVDCHIEKYGNKKCLTCHNYHLISAI